MRNALLILASVLLVTGCGTAAPEEMFVPTLEAPKTSKVKFLTWNMYQGTEVYEAMEGVLAGDPEQIVLGVSLAYARLVSTDVYTRAQAMAAFIAEEEPDLIGLQEATLWRKQYPSDTFTPSPTPAEEVLYDFVEILRTALAAHSLDCDVVAEFTGVDVEFPRMTEFGELEDLRMTDREVILVRRDSKAQVSNPQTGAFETNIVFPNGFTVLRGWAAVDVTVHEHVFRFVSTHLEYDHPDVRLAQAAEILQGPTATELPVVLVGDFNFDLNVGGDERIDLFLAMLGEAGFGLLAPTADGASTCCHDELLVDAAAHLTERLDLILHRGLYQTTHQYVWDPREEGLWASDHAAVYAKVEMEN